VGNGPVRVGTRGSALARAQTELVVAALAARHPGLGVETVVIRTSGDREQRGPLPPSGIKGMFVKEIEEALAAGRIDVGVHSAKDLPAQLAPGLTLAAVPARAPAHDLLIGGAGGGWAGLASGARVGTASVRRRAQLLVRRPDLAIVPLRGNVDTRLQRWRDGDLDAIVLAAAGLARLGIDEPQAHALPIEEFLPAVGQGALGLECRVDDAATCALLAAIDDAPSAIALAAERAFLRGIGGDCNTPLAAHAVVHDGRVALRVLVSDVDGRRVVEDRDVAAVADAPALGSRLAQRLLAAGAGDLLGR
jgi:hydroxymethylbilane synthase